MRIVIILICIVFSATFVFAQADNSVFSTIDDWYHTGESIQVDGINILLTLKGERQSGQLKLLFDNQFAEVLSTSSCQEGELDKYGCDVCVDYKHITVCLDEMYYIFEANNGNKYGIINPETLQVTPGLNLIITDNSPKVTLTRKLEKNTVYVGDEVKFTTTVKNEGESAANNLRITEVFPEHVQIVKANKVVTHDGTSANIKLGGLAAGAQKDFEYTIKLTQPTQANLKATIAYEYLDGQVVDTSSTIPIQADSPLEYSVVFDPSSPDLGNITTFFGSLRNKDPDKSLTIQSLEIPIPVYIDILEVDNITRQDFLMSWSGQIEPEQDYNFSFDFRALKSQGYAFRTGVDYQIGGSVNREDFSNSVSFTSDATLSAEVKFVSENLLTGQEGKVWVLLKNENTFTYEDIILNMTTDIGTNHIIRVDSLEPEEYVTVYEQDFVAPRAPVVNDSTSFHFTVQGSGQAEIIDPITKQPLLAEFSSKDTVTVIPLDEAFAIDVELDPKDPVQNNSVQITVSVENKLARQSFTNVAARDVLPNWLPLPTKRTENVFDLAPKEKKVAYSYVLDLPIKLETFTPNITTYVEVMNIPFNETNQLDIQAESEPDIDTSFSFDSKVVQADTFPVEITIKNNGEHDAYNVRADYTPQFGIEIIDSVWDRIDLLEPGESITLVKLFRGGAQGIHQLNNFTITYEDEYENNFVQRPYPGKVTVEKGDTLAPLILINKTIVNVSGSTAYFKISLRNAGGTPTQVTVNDGAVRWSQSINQRQTKEIYSQVALTGTGNISLSAAQVEYDYQQTTYLSASPDVDVFAEESVAAQIPIAQEVILQQQDVNTETIASDPVVRRTLSTIADNIGFGIVLVALIGGSLLLLYFFRGRGGQ